MKRLLTATSGKSLWITGALSLCALTAIVPPTFAADDSMKAAPEATFWTPVARLNINKPQRITINNKTGLPLDYLITTHTNFRVLEPGKAVTLTNTEIPMFLNINTQDSSSRVKYGVSVDKNSNILTVNVMLTNEDEHRTLNINETGGIYLY
jgi:hypothetical protein